MYHLYIIQYVFFPLGRSQLNWQGSESGSVADPSQRCDRDAARDAHLSPRLEMRLALNEDIVCDEDLSCYRPVS